MPQTSKTESEIEAKGMKLFTSLKSSWWTKISQKSIKGTPDRIGCFKGRFIGLEWKKQGGVISPIQRSVLRKINKSGGLGLVLDDTNYEDIHKLMGELKACPRCEKILEKILGISL